MFEIPEEHLDGFKLLVHLPREQQEKLIKAFAKIEVGGSPDIEEISATTGIDLDTCDAFLPSIEGALTTKTAVSESEEEFSTSIVDSYIYQTNDSSFDRIIAITFFTDLIKSSKGHILTIKGVNLSLERDRLATRFRILTDVRPVFDDNDGQVIHGSVVLQSLVVYYMENGRRRKMSFGIDQTDIDQLKLHLERALEKRKAVETVFKKANMRDINLD